MWPFKTIRRIIVRTLKWLYAFVPFGQFMVRFINWKPLARYHKCKSIMGWSNGKNQGSNSEMNFVGLNNQGATCYLNTLLQTWFMTREVKDCISRSQSPDLLIVALKELFEQLTSEQTNSVCTKKLTTCLQLDVSKQNDIEVCFRNLMSNLSTRMVEENNILKIYQVTMVHSIMCSKCKEPLDNENLFLDIPLSMCSANTFVKFKCMEESLGAFLSVETMEGDNKCYCDVCGEKTESTSRYYFKKLPQILTFQLKRFEFDYNYMQYRKIKDCINLPSDLKFKKSQVDYNEWRLKLPVNKEKDMEDSDISVDNPDVQGQFKITKEEVLTRNKVDKNPGPDGIHRRQLSEENNSGNNYSFWAMEQGQSELSTLQRQEEYSVNDEERTTEAPGQSEQDSTEDKETRASSKYCDEVTEGELSSTSPLQGQSGNSENCEGGTSEAVQDQSEQVSTEDMEKDMEDSDISVDNPDVQGQFKITKEEVLTRNKVDKNPGPDGIHRRQLSEENNSGNNYSFGAMEQGQSELSTLQRQEEYSVNDEERTTEAPGQSEQDSTEDKETRASSKYCDEVTEGEQSSTSPLQGQSGNSENCEGGTSEAVQDQSEQVSTEDMKDMEDSDISVDNPDVQGQFKITKEEVLTRNKVDKNPGPDGIHRRQLSEENNSGNNYSFGAMEQGQSELSTLQRQEEYSVNDEERTTEAPGQSEQDSTEDKETRASSKYCDEVTEGEQSSTSPLQGQSGNSENCEGGTSEAVQDQSEQVSTEDMEKKYELFAIWHHLGSYGGGRYYAEIKSGSGDWYTFDDRVVKKIGKNITLSSTTADMVMYRLIDTNKEAGSDATTPEQCQTQKPIPGTQEYRSQSTVKCDNYTGIVKDSRKSRIV
ncbi:uncharacterized protein LOC144599649 isoform X3 [Rhinoraja longicauda]